MAGGGVAQSVGGGEYKLFSFSWLIAFLRYKIEFKGILVSKMPKIVTFALATNSFVTKGCHLANDDR